MPPDNFDVFLSYHWHDHAHVEALARRVREQNLTVFLDRWYLTPGQSWPKALEATLAQCRAVAVCIGQEKWDRGSRGSNISRWSARWPPSAVANAFPSFPFCSPAQNRRWGF